MNNEFHFVSPKYSDDKRRDVVISIHVNDDLLGDTNYYNRNAKSNKTPGGKGIDSHYISTHITKNIHTHSLTLTKNYHEYTYCMYI